MNHGNYEKIYKESSSVILFSECNSETFIKNQNVTRKNACATNGSIVKSSNNSDSSGIF